MAFDVPMTQKGPAQCTGRSRVRSSPSYKCVLTQLNGKWVDVIFSDLNMPVMNGFDFIEGKGNH